MHPSFLQKVFWMPLQWGLPSSFIIPLSHRESNAASGGGNDKPGKRIWVARP
jgi:hypothetical protein